MQWLRQAPPVRMNVTLYGASDETYDRLCRNPQGFTQATRAIRLLRDAGISVKLNCSLTPYNAADLEGIFAYAKEEKLLVQATSYMFPPLRRDPGQVGRNDRFTPEEAAYYSARIESLMNGEEAFLERRRTQADAGLCAEPGEDCGSLEGEGIRCRAGKCSFWVTWDGRLLPLRDAAGLRRGCVCPGLCPGVEAGCRSGGGHSPARCMLRLRPAGPM